MEFNDVLMLDDDELSNYAASLKMEELEVLQLEFQQHVDELNRKRSLLDPVRDQKAADEEAKRLYASMTDVQKAALAQHIKVESVVKPSKMGDT